MYDHLMATTRAQFWIFAYGSLMWSPGFPVAERVPVRLRGWHRRFSLSSPRSWGTGREPGLCAALHEGGECGGLALRVEKKHAAGVRSQLERREAAYRFRDVTVEAGGGRRLSTLTFVWDPAEPRFRPELSLAEAAGIICRAPRGQMGCSAEYLNRTVEALESAGLDATAERALLAAAERLRPGGRLRA